MVTYKETDYQEFYKTRGTKQQKMGKSCQRETPKGGKDSDP